MKVHFFLEVLKHHLLLLRNPGVSSNLPFLVGVSVESLLAMEIIPRTHGSSDVQQISPKGENPPPGSSWQFCW